MVILLPKALTFSYQYCCDLLNFEAVRRFSCFHSTVDFWSSLNQLFGDNSCLSNIPWTLMIMLSKVGSSWLVNKLLYLLPEFTFLERRDFWVLFLNSVKIIMVPCLWGSSGEKWEVIIGLIICLTIIVDKDRRFWHGY